MAAMRLIPPCQAAKAVAKTAEKPTAAHAPAPHVSAEGVETEGQLEELRELGCDLAQGNFFSEPLTGEAAGGLLEARIIG